MASVQAEGEKAAPIHGAEMTKWTLASPYRIYFRHALNNAIPLTVVYSMMSGYSEARLAYPAPKHVPAKLAWDNGVAAIKRNAIPLIGTFVAFNLTRGWYEQNHWSSAKYDPKPVAAGLAVAAVPFVITVLMNKPNPVLAAALGFCALDYTYDRFSVKPVDSKTWHR